MQLRVVLVLRLAESYKAAPSYEAIGRQLGISGKAVRYHLNMVAGALVEAPGVPAKRRVYAWAVSPDGQTYLGKPHVQRRATEPTDRPEAA